MRRTLTNTATGVSLKTTTNSAGAYEFPTVRPGIYVATSEKQGFSLRWSTTSRCRSAGGCASTST
jgi:hypothetical protein